MPETTFTYRARADFSSVDRAISQTERRITDLNARAETIEAGGGNAEQVRRESAEQTRILRALREKRRALQQQANEQEDLADEARQQGRIQRRATRAYRSLARALEQEDNEARRRLARSASLARNLRDAGPLGLAGAGFGLARGVSTAALGGLGIGAGAAGTGRRRVSRRRGGFSTAHRHWLDRYTLCYCI